MSAAARRDAEIRAVVRALGEGEVVSYGDVAADAGLPGRARLVGRLLAGHDADADPDGPLPWWRVVTSSGRLVPGAEREQAAALAAEGVEVRGGHVRRAPVGRFARRPERAEGVAGPTRRARSRP